MRHAPARLRGRREEDVQEGVSGRPPRQADGDGQREHFKVDIHGAQRSLVRV